MNERLTTRQRIVTTIIMIIVASVWLLAAQTEKAASAGLEPDATFNDDGTCIEQDGTPGLSNGTGDCVTVADYDVLYGYDNLADTPSLSDPTRSVSEVYNLESGAASERLLGVGLVGTPLTFSELVGNAEPGLYRTSDDQIVKVLAGGSAMF